MRATFLLRMTGVLLPLAVVMGACGNINEIKPDASSGRGGAAGSGSGGDGSSGAAGTSGGGTGGAAGAGGSDRGGSGPGGGATGGAAGSSAGRGGSDGPGSGGRGGTGGAPLAGRGGTGGVPLAGRGGTTGGAGGTTGGAAGASAGRGGTGGAGGAPVAGRGGAGRHDGRWPGGATGSGGRGGASGAGGRGGAVAALARVRRFTCLSAASTDKTYSNSCEAACVGVAVAYQGDVRRTNCQSDSDCVQWPDGVGDLLRGLLAEDRARPPTIHAYARATCRPIAPASPASARRFAVRRRNLRTVIHRHAGSFWVGRAGCFHLALGVAQPPCVFTAAAWCRVLRHAPQLTSERRRLDRFGEVTNGAGWSDLGRLRDVAEGERR